MPLVLGSVYLLLRDRVWRRQFFKPWAIRLIFIYIILLLTVAVIARTNQAVSSKAMWYGLLVDLRFLIFFLTVLIIAAYSNWLLDNWTKLLIGPAILVVSFAILQYLVLPTDFLKHFGYGDATISPYETINKHVQNLRVASTLRGANNLGAYLVLPICALTVAFWKPKMKKRDLTILGFGLVLALIFSFSRSAWIGASLGVLLISWISIKSPKLKRGLVGGISAIFVVAVLLSVTLHDNATFQHVFLHTDRTPTTTTSSNEGHKAAFESASRDILHEPLGRGVGTAGPASSYNYHQGGRISENYFLQIGQEAGWPAMGLFIAICAFIAKILWDRRREPLALWLFASLVGVSIINLLSHAWTDDTLAYIWWGLAGVSVSPIIMNNHKRKNGKKIKISSKRNSPVR